MTSAGRDEQAELAWANALERSARSIYRYRGLPEDSGNNKAQSHAEVSWEAAAALAEGMLALAQSAQRQGLTWRQVAALAQAELHEIQHHLAYLATPTPRGGR